MTNELLEVWQPSIHLIGEDLTKVILSNIIHEGEMLKIVLKDKENHILDIIYDEHPDPIESVVWSYRHTPDSLRLDLHSIEQDFSQRVDKQAIYFFKMRNSKYIEWLNQNEIMPIKARQNLQHHIYGSDDETFEVLSTYEPRFVER